MTARQLTDRGRERRRQLIDVASRCFAERGYHPTSVTEIVNELGVGKGVFYWYFDSKEELFLEILKGAQHDLRRRQQAAIAGLDDPLDQVAAGVRAAMEWADQNRPLVSLVQFAATEELFASAIRIGQAIAVADARFYIDAALDAGGETVDPDLMIHAMLGVTFHLAQTYLLEGSRPVDEVADAAVRFCLTGLSGRPS